MQSVREVAGVSSVRDANAAEEFLFHVNRCMRIVDSVLIAVGERTPTHANDGRIAQILRNPLAVVEILFQGLRLNEKALGTTQEQSVVNRVVLRLAAVFKPDLVDLLQVPTERNKDRINQGGLCVLLANDLLPVPDLLDSLADCGQRFQKCRLLHDLASSPSQEREGSPHLPSKLNSEYSPWEYPPVA